MQIGIGINPVLNTSLRIKGAQYGPEVVSNTGFSSDTIWTKGTGWTISGGVAVGTAASGNLSQTGLVIPIGTYRTEFTISGYSSGDVQIEIAGNGNVLGAVRNANGTYIENLVVPNSPFATIVRINPGTNFTGNIDNVSVKQIL